MTVGPTLPHEVTPEDLALGYLWGSRFRNAYDEVAKGGTIYGTPLINKSVNLNGTTDYIAYVLNGQFNNIDPIGFHIIVGSGNFASDDNVEYVIFDTVPTIHYTLRKLSTNHLQLRLGNATIINVEEAIWGPVWIQGGRNIFTVSSTSGATDILLNNVQIATAVAIAWTPTVPTRLDIGARAGAAGWFNGQIDMIKFYSRLIPEIEHKNLWKAIGAMI